MKLVFATPSYGPMDPQAVISQRNAIMHAAANGVTWLGDASPDRMKFDAARNAVVHAVLYSPDSADADGIFWCDSDVVLPSHAITSLVQTGHDFITGMYFQRRAPHWPLVAQFDPKGGPDKTGSFRWLTHWPEDVVGPVEGCGFGCVLTSTRLLRAMGDGPWFTFEKYSEDFDFCLRAARAGFQLHVHTGVLCGHLADPVPVTVQDFQRVWEQEHSDGAIRQIPA